MNISVTIFVILISTCIVNASVLDPVIENVVHLQASKPPSGVPGIWKKKTIWKPRWVKEWKSAKVMKPVWKKVWSPVQIREWVPVPKPPPGWDSGSTPLVPVKTAPKEIMPLWDPVPYPESQQPPPPSHDAHYPPCGNGGCGEPLAFNHQQISGIIGLNRHKNTPDYSQNVEYSETVTHLTRIPPNGNWGQPLQQTGNFQFDNRFNNLPELSPFLVPPKFQPLSENNLHFHFRNPQPKPQPSRPSAYVQVSHSSGFEVNPSDKNKTPPWIPLPPQNNIKGHFITKAPDQPYKFESPETSNKNNTREVFVPEVEPSTKPGFKAHNTHPVDGDFIQEAQLVSEYHYSEFDLARDLKPQPAKPELPKPEFLKPELVQKEEVKPKPQPRGKTPQVPQQIAQKGGQKPAEGKRNPQPVVESKPRQVRKDGRQPQQPSKIPNNPHFNSSTPSFQQQEAMIKEIFPIFIPAETSTPFPSNHRFAPLKDNTFLEKTPPTSFNLFNRTIAQFLRPEIVFHPEHVTPNLPQPHTSEQSIVPEFENKINTEQTHKTTDTTTPYTIFPNSSFPSTTEAETEGPVFVVTPAYTINS